MIKETDPPQLKGISQAFSQPWNDATFTTLFNGWSNEELEDAHQKVTTQVGTGYAANVVFNLIPQVVQMQDFTA